MNRRFVNAIWITQRLAESPERRQRDRIQKYRARSMRKTGSHFLANRAPGAASRRARGCGVSDSGVAAKFDHSLRRLSHRPVDLGHASGIVLWRRRHTCLKSDATP